MAEMMGDRQRSTDVEAILSGPDYFRCEKTHTRMKKEECIRRQGGVKRRLEHGATWQDIPVECEGCQQGEKIRGQRAEDRGQTAEEGEMKKKGSPKVCIEPGCEETHIKARGRCSRHYNNWYSREQRKAGGKTLIDRGIGYSKKVPGAANMVTLNFEEYPDVLMELKEKAQEEFRSIELQSLFLIKKALGN